MPAFFAFADTLRQPQPLLVQKMTAVSVADPLALGSLAISALLLYRPFGRSPSPRVRSIASLLEVALALCLAWAILAGCWAGDGRIWLYVATIAIALVASRPELERRVEAGRPLNRLWALNRQALEILVIWPDHPELDGRLWDLLREMENIDEPSLRDLRQMLTWRYYAYWDPESDIEMLKSREVLIDQLERRVWPHKDVRSRQEVEEYERIRELHKAIGELVRHVRQVGVAGPDPARDTLIRAVEAQRRQNTNDLVDELLRRVELGQVDVPAEGLNVPLPNYRMQDGVGADRGCLDSAPLFGLQLSDEELRSLHDEWLRVIDRLHARQVAAGSQSSPAPIDESPGQGRS